MPPEALARFLPQWQGISARRRPRDRRPGARHRAAAGRVVPASRARDARAAVAGRRLLPRDARRADRLRRGALGRAGLAAGQRRLGVAAARRHRRPAAAAAGRPDDDAAARRRSSRRSTAARRCSSASCPTGSSAADDAALQTALWDLVWAGHLTNDTLAPLRALLGTGTTAHAGSARPVRQRSRYGRPVCRPAPDRRRSPGAGRCCPTATPTRRGARTRSPRRCSTGTASSPAARSSPSACPAASPRSTRCSRRSRRPAGCAAATSSRGSARRSSPLREPSTGCARSPPHADRPTSRCGRPRCPAAGTPRRPQRQRQRRDEAARRRAGRDRPGQPVRRGAPLAGHLGEGGHRPARKAGALVVLVDGALVLYVERGGKTLLSFPTTTPASVRRSTPSRSRSATGRSAS